jgi:ABC-type polysaccharide/polyol phosphate transport system ATPase subunit
MSSPLTAQNLDEEFLIDPMSSKMPEEGDGKWKFVGDGKAEIVTDFLRLVGIGGAKSTFQHAIELSRHKQLIVDVRMRRISGGDEDCIFWADNGISKEIVRINKDYVYLTSNSSRVSIDTNNYQNYRLVMDQNRSLLFVDDAIELFSKSLMKGSSNILGFGSVRGTSEADSESHWQTVRVFSTGVPLDSMQLVNNGLKENIVRAQHCLTESNMSDALKRIAGVLFVQHDNVAALEVLKTAMRSMKSTDSVSMNIIDKLLVELSDPDILAEWNSTMKNLMRDKIVIAKEIGVKFKLIQANSLSGMWDNIFSFDPESRKSKYTWILRDVSMDAEAGEIIGVIGRNGAGKSTLLRILAGIMAPDEGTLMMKGKSIALSRGLGFKEELSGKDNVLLGGLFLGMSMKEIKNKYDEIVDFAELRPDIDKPFKFYSDGMKSRLIFSLATSVDPDILMLDELLSAGDASFTVRATRRMEQLVRKSRCALIVTHNMRFVRDTCTRALYIEKGGVKFFGDPNKAVDMYLADSGLFT